jgi:hypothetical protein
MIDKMKTTEESDYSVTDEILKGLTAKVTEMGSTVKETTAQAKKMSDQMSGLPLFGQQMEVMGDSLRKLQEGFEKMKQAVGQMGEEIGSLPDKVVAPMDSIAGLRSALSNHTQLFEKPLRKEVHYRHFVGWPIKVILGMCVIVMVSVAGWWNAGERVSDSKQDELKYRFVKLQGNTAVQQVVDAAEEAWQADPDQFKKLVEAREEQDRQWYESVKAKMKLDSEAVEMKKQKALPKVK